MLLVYNICHCYILDYAKKSNSCSLQSIGIHLNTLNHGDSLVIAIVLESDCIIINKSKVTYAEGLSWCFFKALKALKRIREYCA